MVLTIEYDNGGNGCFAELLEACKGAREQLRFYDKHFTIKNHDKELLASLDAAIAKAEKGG